jgi:MATE family multidrug resistance protein
MPGGVDMVISYIQKRWSAEGGYRQLLQLAFPLILSTGSWAVLHFVDRMLLTWYSRDALAAAMPAGILNFALVSVFVGSVSYAGTFVAQYFGAGKNEKIGKVIWHVIYFSVIGMVLVMAFVPLTGPLFRLIGHAPKVQEMEIIYFRILCFGGLGPILSAGFGGFFSGRGKNWPVMWVNVITTCINLLLDYLLIFGIGPFPELGVFGAGLATVIAGLFSIVLYVILIFNNRNEQVFKVASSWKPDLDFIARFLRFGLPSGVHFFLEIIGFSLFLLIIGRIGTNELAASNMAFNINTFAFMPMLGTGIAVSILVGQSIGEGNVKRAAYATWSATHLSFTYMSFFAILYLLVPDFFIFPFAAGADPKEFEPIREIALILLRFVALYSIFDTIAIIFSNAIKGAGDTRFVMVSGVVLSFGVLVIPTFIAIILFNTSLYLAWLFCSVYIVAMGFVFLARFLHGKWKTMRVIEPVGRSGLPSEFPVNPCDVDCPD